MEQSQISPDDAKLAEMPKRNKASSGVYQPRITHDDEGLKQEDYVIIRETNFVK